MVNCHFAVSFLIYRERPVHSISSKVTIYQKRVTKEYCITVFVFNQTSDVRRSLPDYSAFHLAFDKPFPKFV